MSQYISTLARNSGAIVGMIEEHYSKMIVTIAVERLAKNYRK
jgi:hypothetical protein